MAAEMTPSVNLVTAMIADFDAHKHGDMRLSPRECAEVADMLRALLAAIRALPVTIPTPENA